MACATFKSQVLDGERLGGRAGGVITGNNLVWRKVNFAAVTTTKIRLSITATANQWSRLAEVEAYTASGGSNAAPTATIGNPTNGASYAAPATISIAASATDPDGTISKVDFFANGAFIGTDSMAPYTFDRMGVSAGNYTFTAVATDNLGLAGPASPTVAVTVTGPTGRANVALASAGATALASSTYGAGYSPAGAINGDRRGTSWGAGGGWNDATASTWPDWLEVDFSGRADDRRSRYLLRARQLQRPGRAERSDDVHGTGCATSKCNTGRAACGRRSRVGRSRGQHGLAPSVICGRDDDQDSIFVTNALNTWSRITEVEAYTVARARPPHRPSPSMSSAIPKTFVRGFGERSWPVGKSSLDESSQGASTIRCCKRGAVLTRASSRALTS